MHQYKSLMMVAVLSGVMVIMAGILLSTEQVARKRNADSTGSSASWSHLGASAAADRNGLFERSLGRIRLMIEANAEQRDPSLDRLVSQATALANETSLPAIQAELARPDLPPRLREICCRLVGAARAPESLQVLEELYAADPRAAIRGIECRGGPASAELLVRIQSRETDPQLRAEILKALPALSAQVAVDHLGSTLATTTNPVETELAILLLAATRSDESRDHLARFLADPNPHESRLDQAAIGGLAAMSAQDGAAMLLELHRDQDLPGARRISCGEALAAVHAPGLVAGMLEEVLVGKELSLQETTFLERNLRRADRAKLAEAMAKGLAGDTLRRLSAGER